MGLIVRNVNFGGNFRGTFPQVPPPPPGPTIVTENLVFNIDAGNSSSYSGSGSTWLDLSGNGNNGTLIGSSSYTATAPGYFTFTGGYVNMGSLNLQRNFTLEIWCYITADNSAMFGQGPVFVNNAGLHIFTSYFNGRGIVFGMYYNDMEIRGFNTAFNTWNQFCFTYNHSTYTKQFYANGALFASSPGNQYTGSGQFNVGGTYSSPRETMKGQISISRMYSAVLSAAQVTQNYDAVKTRFGK